MLDATHPDLYDRLAKELQGKTLVVPNMLGPLRDWPSGNCNPHYERLRHVIDGLLDSVVPDEKIRQKLKDSDFAMFTSIWFHGASWENLILLGLLSLWAFIWDDTIDTNEQSLSTDFERACQFREQSLDFCLYWLDVQDDGTGGWWRPRESASRLLSTAVSRMGYRPLPPPCPLGGCIIFKEIGEKLCEKYDDVQRRRVYRELKFFFRCAEQEQAERLAGCIPTYDSYLENRYGTTAFRVFCAVAEVATETHIPARIMDSPLMEAVWREANLLIIIINDILSLKKEMTTHCMINLVPILYHHGNDKSLDAIVQKLMAELHASRDRCDVAIQALLRNAADEDKMDDTTNLEDQLDRYLDVLMTMVTGTFEYSLAVKRYGIQKDVKEDGSLVITL